MPITYDGQVLGSTPTSLTSSSSVSNSVPLSTILNRMNRWTTIYRNTEEQYLVYDLDDSIRALLRDHRVPWQLKKSTLKVFSDVLEYPVASDHNTLAFLQGQEEFNRPDFNYTSIEEFYNDPNSFSQIAEIWDNGTKILGVKNKNLGTSNQIIDTCESDENYTISDDISAKDVDNVIYKTGNGSLKLTIINSADVATLEKTFTSFTDSLYKRKYVFFRVYLAAVPSSINLRVGGDSSNYLLKNVTTQFSGQAFKANDWNLVAIDLNEPDSITGTVDSSTSFSYYMIQLNEASSGYYYIDEVSLKEWKMIDYWYYSFYNIKTLGYTTANQRFFMNSSEIYSTDSEIVGPEHFIDVVMYGAILSAVTDIENSKIYSAIERKYQKAFDKLIEDYPSLDPLVISHYYRFSSQLNNLPLDMYDED